MQAVGALGMSIRRLLAGGMVIVALGALAACSSTSSTPPPTALGDDAITVGSFDFPESTLLAEIYSQAIESKGFEVERQFGIGPRELVLPAMSAGFIEFVPEYLGTAEQFLSLGAGASGVRCARDPSGTRPDPANRELGRAHLVAGTGRERVLRHECDRRSLRAANLERRREGRPRSHLRRPGGVRVTSAVPAGAA